MSPRALPIIPGSITIDPTDLQVQWILGRTCLFCGPIAHILQKAGFPIETNAEAEQAQVIAWMLALYRDHGENWRAVGQEFLAAMRRETEAKNRLVGGQS